MTVIRGVDASAWTKEIPPQAWESMYQDGVRFFIPQIWGSPNGANPYLGQHVDGAAAANIIILGGYIWPSWKWPEAKEHWLREVGAPLDIAWLDVEAGAGVHPDQIDDLREQDIIPGIYASRHSWASIMGAESTYTDCPLWVAHYRPGQWPTSLSEGDVPCIPDSWVKPVIWQWMGTTTLRDDQYDLNVADEDWVYRVLEIPPTPLPEEEEETLSSQEFEQLQREIATVRGTANSAESQVTSLRGDFREHIEEHQKERERPPSRPGQLFHTVVSGDTASGIAAQHGISFAQLKRLNPGLPRSGNWNLIHPGEQFRYK